jgi:integrase/recombinase XerD
MTALRRAVDDYVALRRQLGVTLHEAGRVLTAFATYAQREGVEYVTTALVLRWASQLTHVSPATINGRVQMIRRFAQWRQLTDARTEIPAVDLLPGRYRRRAPRLYREDDIPRLLQAARQLPSAKSLRGRTYATLFGLLTVTRLRRGDDPHPSHQIRQVSAGAAARVDDGGAGGLPDFPGSCRPPTPR